MSRHPRVSQRLIVGAEGGLRLTGDTPQYGSSDSKPYLVGPKIELGLPLHFALEVDMLYSRLGNTSYIPSVANESKIRTIANSWAFPFWQSTVCRLLARIRFCHWESSRDMPAAGSTRFITAIILAM